MSANPFGPPDLSSTSSCLDDDGRSFFDQLSAEDESEPVTEHLSEALPVEAITSTHSDLTTQPTTFPPYNPSQDTPLTSQTVIEQPANATTEEPANVIQDATPGNTGQSKQQTATIEPVAPPQDSTAIENYPPGHETINLPHPSMSATQFNIPLTPQYDSSVKDSVFANQMLTPEPLSTTSSQENTVPTQLTPVQSAMMMSMTTSMLVSNPSPNTMVDIEATTVKFQQASLDSTGDLLNQNQSTGTAAKEGVVIPATASPLLGQPKDEAVGSKNTPSSGLPQDTFNMKSKQNESNLLRYFGGNKKTYPFDNMATQITGSGNDSAMINPVYMSPTDNFNISNAIPSPDSFLTPATEQDVFTASLLSSDADRRHDAWIPSESTKQALVAMATTPPGTYFPEKELLTMPGIAVKEDFGDPVKNLVRTYLGEDLASKRTVLTAGSVTQDDRGLRQLIASGCYHAAVNLTTQLLTVYGQGEGRAGHPSKHTAHSIQLWFTRIALLIKLRRFSLAEVECQYFGDLDAPDLYFEFYPELYGGRKGSMVPFGFRLLVAELPQHLGKHTQALDCLNTLLRTCDLIIKNLGLGLSEDGSNLEMTTNMRDDSLKLWRTRRHRVIYSITNCAVSLKDFRLAGGLLERLIQEDPNSAAGLYSALGRLCLQLGDVTAAQETFNQHLEHSPPPPHHDPVQGLLHSAYVSIAQNSFKDAAEILQQAHKLNANNGLVINNLGVCLMYTGRVSEAIKLMEGAVFSQPERFLHEALVLNLATMYELESSNAHQKKLKLLSLIAQHKGDSFNVAALKLQPQ